MKGRNVVLALVLCAVGVRAGWRNLQDICDMLVDEGVRSECTECFNNATQSDDKSQAKECAGCYLPPKFQSCTKVLEASNPTVLEDCLAKQREQLKNTNERAKILEKKGGNILKKVAHSNVLDHGGPVMLSCMAQEIYLSDNKFKKLIQPVAKKCYDRYSKTPSRRRFMLTSNKSGYESRQLDGTIYSYGAMGHDLPFHGVGPLATDVLFGHCLADEIVEAGLLNELVGIALSNPGPIPAWMFQAMINNVESISLPE